MYNMNITFKFAATANKVFLLVRCPSPFEGYKCDTNETMDKCPDYQDVFISGSIS